MTRRQDRAIARLGGALAAFMLALHAPSSLAASGGIALVVGEGQYAGQPVLPGCSQTAHAVSARLRRLGFTIDETIDGSAVNLRDALSDFAARAAAAPQGPVLAYVCAEATAVDRRLFVLPSDVNLQQKLRPETQAVVLRALLNAMAGTKGTMVAELGMPPGAETAPITAALQEALPTGLHLALTMGDGKQAGSLGTRLAGDGTELDQGWDRLAAALQGSSQGAPTAIALYEPPPTPLPTATPAPAPIPLRPAATVAAEPPAAAPRQVAVPPAPTPQPVAVPPAPTPQLAAAPPSPDAAPAAPEGTDAPQPAKSAADGKAARPRPGSEERIRRLQAALTRHGFYSGPLDGVQDARTVQAIYSYQISIGDPASGTLTQTEIIRLLNNW